MTPIEKKFTSNYEEEFARDVSQAGRSFSNYENEHLYVLNQKNLWKRQIPLEGLTKQILITLSSDISLWEKSKMMQGYKKIIGRFEQKPNDLKRKLSYLFSASMRENILSDAKETLRKSNHCLDAIINAGKALNRSEMKLNSLENGEDLHPADYLKNLQGAKNYLKVLDVLQLSYSYPSFFNAPEFRKKIEDIEKRYALINQTIERKQQKIKKFLNSDSSFKELKKEWIDRFLFLPQFDGKHIPLPDDKTSILEMIEINASFLKIADPLERKQIRQLHQLIIECLKNRNCSDPKEIIALNRLFYSQLIQSVYLRTMMNRTKFKQIDDLCKNWDLDKAIAAANQLNLNIVDKEAFIRMNPFLREPLENPKKNTYCIKEEEQISRFIPYERFRSALRKSFSETLKDILELPMGQNDYVIIGDREYKSANWAISHVLDLMSIHPPKAVIDQDFLNDYLNCNPSVNTIVKIDDASYSGEQVSRYIDSEYANKNVFICIPYITSFAKKVIAQRLLRVKAGNFSFKNKEIMLTYKEMLERGWNYAYVKNLRPNIKQFLKMPAAKENAGINLESMNKVRCWNTEVANAQKTIFQQFNKTISLDQQTLDRFATLSKHLNKIKQFISNEKELQIILNNSSTLTPRFGIHENLRLGFLSNKNNQHLLNYGESRTPTWLASKEADTYSSIPRAMENAVISLTSAAFKSLHLYRYVIIEPYKNMDSYIEWRKKTVDQLKSESLDLVQRWEDSSKDLELPPIEIIRSNRGIFLLGDNFYGNKMTNPSCIKITSRGKSFPFGGSDGAFQFQIKEGVPFSIEYRGKTKEFVF